MDRTIVDYFISETDKKFSRVEKRFDTVEEKLDLLFRFKWQIIGGAGTAGFITSVIGALLFEWIRR